MQFPYHALIGTAARIPVPDPVSVVSYSPVVLPAPGRLVDIQLRVTVPAPLNSQGKQQQPSVPLPIILLAHGAGPSHYLSSLDGYAPLAEFYSSRGFAVLQPTLLDSAFLGLAAAGSPPPEGDEALWRERRRTCRGCLTMTRSTPSRPPCPPSSRPRRRTHPLRTGAASTGPASPSWATPSAA